MAGDKAGSEGESPDAKTCGRVVQLKQWEGTGEVDRALSSVCSVDAGECRDGS